MIFVSENVSQNKIYFGFNTILGICILNFIIILNSYLFLHTSKGTFENFNDTPGDYLFNEAEGQEIKEEDINSFENDSN